MPIIIHPKPQVGNNRRHSSRRPLPLLLLLSVAIATIATPVAQADMGETRAAYNATPPAFGSSGDTTVPADAELRWVFGSLTLSPSALSATNMTISFCGGATIENFNIPPISGNTLTWGYNFIVRGNDCYRFNNNLDPNGANKISSYNWVEAINQTFESQAHANSTYETQTHANETWRPYSVTNSTHPLAPAGLHLNFVGSSIPIIGFGYDPNSTRPGDDVIYYIGSVGPYTVTNPETEAYLLYQPIGTCSGEIEIWSQDPFTLEESPHESIPYNCLAQVGAASLPIVENVTAISNETSVHISWQVRYLHEKDNQIPEGYFQIEGNDSSSLPRHWGSYHDIAGTPFYVIHDSGARYYDAPLADFPTGTTYLDVEFWAAGPINIGGNPTGATMSCEVAFIPDEKPHFCYNLAPTDNSSSDDDSEYATYDFVNTTFCPVTNCTSNDMMQGNFTGNFTGNVTDMSALPPSISIPLALVAVAAIGIAIAFFFNNIGTSFIGIIIELVGIFVSTGIDAGFYRKLLYVVMFILCFVVTVWRGYTCDMQGILDKED